MDNNLLSSAVFLHSVKFVLSSKWLYCLNRN